MNAFEREALRSERTRIIGILTVLGAIAIYVAVRSAVFGGVSDPLMMLRAFGLVGLLALYELGTLEAIRRAALKDRPLPDRFWTLNVVVESLLPTLSLVILTESKLFGPYRALVAPVVLTYFFFITLSTLRLNPPLARMTGFVSALGYVAVVAFTSWRHPEPPRGMAPIGEGLYLSYPVFLMFGGWIAGIVAGQIRRHVTATLDEAVRNERLHRDLEVARSIQQGLLPVQPPRVAGFDIAGWNKPADQTGGDFFYWEQLEDGRVAIAVADVTGHGIGPALIASVSRAYARACVGNVSDLGAAMTRIDTLLGEDLPAGKLVNFISAVVGPDDSTVGMLSAGQAPLLVYRAASDSIESFKAHGVPLGVGLGLGYGPAQQVTMQTGDMLVLMTDGFFEWENAQEEQFGLDRLNETIRRAKDLPASDVIAKLHTDVLDFANGTEQADDLTAVIIRRS